MLLHKLGGCVLAGIWVLESLACANSVDDSRTFDALGIVSNINGDVIYEEHHSHKAGIDGAFSHVKYLSPDGTTIALKRVDYNCRTTSPAYQLTMNNVTPWIEQVYWENDRLVISDPDGTQRLETNPSGSLVIDAGFDQFIFENWDELSSGVTKKIHFLHVPGRKWINMTVSRTENIETTADFTDAEMLFFRIKISNPLIRLFTDSVYLGYESNSRQLMFYSGPSNLRGTVAGLDQSGQITITYSY